MTFPFHADVKNCIIKAAGLPASSYVSPPRQGTDGNSQTAQSAENCPTDALPFIKHGTDVITQEELDRSGTSWAANYDPVSRLLRIPSLSDSCSALHPSIFIFHLCFLSPSSYTYKASTLSLLVSYFLISLIFIAGVAAGSN